MSSTGLDVFDTTIEKTNSILKEIERQMGWEERRNQAYLALRTSLHALRDRLPLLEAVHLSAQLPLLLKGVYFDGWNPAEVPIKMNREEFVQRVAREFQFDVEGGVEEMIRTTLGVVFNHIDPSESDKILNELPKDIAMLFINIEE